MQELQALQARSAVVDVDTPEFGRDSRHCNPRSQGRDTLAAVAAGGVAGGDCSLGSCLLPPDCDIVRGPHQGNI